MKLVTWNCNIWDENEGEIKSEMKSHGALHGPVIKGEYQW